MADYFAVADVGSNALRFQLACVDHPGCYRILEEDRKPVRLGREVFRTGSLNAESAAAALEALRDFKSSADSHRVRAFRAVATSALREASDGGSFIARVQQQVGVALEIILGDEEARLISLGIMSDLRFDLPLSLFVDMGGGSMEVILANPIRTLCFFSLPLGAVRLTEKFIHRDPPKKRELDNLHDFAQQQLTPVAKRVGEEKFAMAFGTGGTIRALADTDARLTGATGADSLVVLSKARLQALLDLLRSQTIFQRATLISADPRRADIIIAGGEALWALVTRLRLDYLFVSKRGLRDGVMVDLLRNHYPDTETLWREDGGRGRNL
jgi:exopolyphosphatase/guanosine-5'-triphosphate,3'-diphosphate pyrophosphatase